MTVLSTLLPEARVDLFVTDVETSEAARQLSTDWRFARVRVQVSEGDIATAVNRYGHEKSPNLIIIETNHIDDSFTNHLEALANVCATETAAVFIGPQNDISLYRRLLDMGATDYLVRPLKTHDMINVISKTLLERLGTHEAQVITVMGAKGGVGTSRVAQMLTHGIAQQGSPATVLDCGGSWGLFSSTYARDPMITLRDLATLVRTQADTLDDLIHKVTPQISWIATGGDPLLNSTMTSDGLEGIIDAMTRRHPHIVVDLSQSSTGIRAMAFAKSHHIVIVTTATPLALRNTRLLLKEIHQLRGNDAPVYLVVNEIGLMPKEELSARDIQQALGLSPAAQIAFQPDLFAKLDTADPGPAITLLDSLSSSLNNLVHLITGRNPAVKQQDTDQNSFLKRFMKRG
jgi:pilus assembly protein CpaE